jgi:hypothetical protein
MWCYSCSSSVCKLMDMLKQSEKIYLLSPTVKQRLHDTRWLARVKSQQCARRHFVQVMKSSTGFTFHCRGQECVRAVTPLTFGNCTAVAGQLFTL